MSGERGRLERKRMIVGCVLEYKMVKQSLQHGEARTHFNLEHSSSALLVFYNNNNNEGTVATKDSNALRYSASSQTVS